MKYHVLFGPIKKEKNVVMTPAANTNSLEPAQARQNLELELDQYSVGIPERFFEKFILKKKIVEDKHAFS